MPHSTFLSSIAFCASVVLVSASVHAQSAPAGSQPLRVLALTGGGHHDFTRNPELLAEGLREHLSLELTTVRLRADSEPDAATPEERPARVLTADLADRYDAILAYTQGEKLGLKREEIDNLLSFVRRGGAFVGIHCAADSFKWNREYVAMVGGKFRTHPPIGPLKAMRIGGEHPVLDGVDDFENVDEFYYLDDCRLDDKHVVLVGAGPTDGKLRPLAWTSRYGEGRVFVTVLGHGPEAHGSAPFRRLIANGLRWTTTRPHWAPDADGWRTLFDGRTRDGWTHVGPGSFKVVDGALETNGGMGMLWFDRMKFGDFELEVDFRFTKPTDNAGVFVRFPNAPRSPWDAVNEGYEVQMCDAGDPKTRTGAIYSFAAATKSASKPIGEWNRMRVEVVGQQYRVDVNGERVCEFVGDRGRAGYIGLQNHAAGEVVTFRRIRAREIEAR
jgi:type 1 glutamine amidotransferase